MRWVLVSSIVTVFAAPARAQPVTGAEDCAVTIVRAPHEVRTEIEAALAPEPCTMPLEVRVVPTEGGFYVLARDFGGRVRERVAPDARTAAVLVASWAAGDRLAPQSPSIIHPPTSDDWVDDAPAPPRPDDERRLEIFGLFNVGARLAIDLAARGRWTLGAAAAISDRPLLHVGYSTINAIATQTVHATDARALGYIGGIFGTGRWTVRTTVGAGVTYTRIVDDVDPMGSSSLEMPSTHDTAERVRPMAEGLAVIGRDIGARWGIDAGLIVSLYGQHVQVAPLAGYESLDPLEVSHALDVQLALGLRYRL